MTCLLATSIAEADTAAFESSMNSTHEMTLLAGAAEGGYKPIWISNITYSSHIEAAAAASNRFNPLSIQEDREYVGIVLKSQGDTPYFTYTISQGSAGANAVPLRIAVPQGFELAAFWHTHGAEHWSRVYFSNADTALAQKWGVPIYLANHVGSLQVFNPDSRTRSTAWAQRKGFGRIAGIAAGDKARAQSGQHFHIETQI